jgi:nucleoside-triphosphatase THEP1
MTRPSGEIVLLTGDRGSGKTTACRKLQARAQASGLDCAGIVCPAVFQRGAKVGIDVEDVRTGERRQLASMDGRPARLRLGPFRFDEGSLAWGARQLEIACPCDVLIVDEIGPLEIERGEGWTNALDILAGAEYGLAVVVVRPSLLSGLRERLGSLVTAVVACSSPGSSEDPCSELEALLAGLTPSSGGPGQAAH